MELNRSNTPVSPKSVGAAGNEWEEEFRGWFAGGQYFRSKGQYGRVLRYLCHLGWDLSRFRRLDQARALVSPLASDIFFRRIDEDFAVMGIEPLQRFEPLDDTSRANPHKILGRLLILDMILAICAKVHRAEYDIGQCTIGDVACFRITVADRHLLIRDALAAKRELNQNKREFTLTEVGGWQAIERARQLAAIYL